MSETYLILFMDEWEGKRFKAFSENTLKAAKEAYDILKQNQNYTHLVLAKVIESTDSDSKRMNEK